MWNDEMTRDTLTLRALPRSLATHDDQPYARGHDLAQPQQPKLR
jgi:hypothetical protein